MAPIIELKRGTAYPSQQSTILNFKYIELFKASGLQCETVQLLLSTAGP